MVGVNRRGLLHGGPETPDKVALLFLCVLLFAPFYLNDFAFRMAVTGPHVLAIDYLSKIIVLAVVVFLPPFRKTAKASFTLARRPGDTLFRAWLRLAAYVVAGTVTMGLVDYFVAPFAHVFAEEKGWAGSFSFQKLEASNLIWLDLTLGLALTAVVEEITSRSILKSVIGRFTNSTVILVVASSIIFSMTHWSNGAAVMVLTFLDGVVFMAMFLKSGSIMPGIAAHYLFNFRGFFLIYFGG